MPSSVARLNSPGHLPRTERSTGRAPQSGDEPRTLSRKAEDDEAWRVAVGQAIDAARQLARLSLKEFAGVIGRNERQVARWISGAERPQFDALFAVEALRKPLVIAFAQLAGQAVEVETVVRVKRTA